MTSINENIENIVDIDDENISHVNTNSMDDPADTRIYGEAYVRQETPQEILTRIARNEDKLDKIYTEFNLNLKAILKVLLIKTFLVIITFLLNAMIVINLINLNYNQKLN